MKNLTKETILQAIQRIKENPELIKGRESSTYDLVLEGKKYPPILVLSEANKIAGGEELLLSDFGNSTKRPFSILKELGFNVLEKGGFYSQLVKFLKQARTTDLTYSHYQSTYLGLKVRVSFGQGNTARIPWISFLGDKQKTSKGIYPVYLLYKSINKLVLAYGVSETEVPSLNWNFSRPKEKIKQYFTTHKFGNPERYGESYLFEIYDLNNLPPAEKIDNDLNSIIEEYNNALKKKETNAESIIFEIQRPKVEQPKVELSQNKQPVTFFSVNQLEIDISSS